MSASAGRSANPLRAAAADAAARLPWLVDAYRLVRHPRWTLEISRDLEATRRSAEFLRALAAPSDGAPTALVALYRDNIYETKLALVLATALRLQGFRIVVSIPTNRAARVRRYAAAYGLHDVLAQDQLPRTPEQDDERARARDELLRSGSTFEAIKNWSFRGRPVGQHVLSTLIRVTFDGSPDLGIERNQDLLAAILDDVLLNVMRAEELLGRIQPRLVLVEEANYSTNGPLVDVAVEHSIEVIQTVGLWREDALMSKRLTAATRRVDAVSVAPETLAALEQQPWTSREDEELDRDFTARYDGTWTLGSQFQPDTRPYAADEIVRELRLDPQRPTAVIFAHVLWDASLFFGVDLFENYADWLVQSVRAAAANPALNWVVKAHPSNVFRSAHGDVGGESSEVVLVRDHFPELPDHVRLLLPETKISTLSLYEFADYGITVRGTPGLEIACFGKPALTAGTGSYSGLGFTVDSETAQEYLDRLASIHHSPPLSREATRAARRYAHALFVRRPWRTESFALTFDFGEEGWHPIDRNVALGARSVQDIVDHRDLVPWARWASECSRTDYVEERRA